MLISVMNTTGKKCLMNRCTFVVVQQRVRSEVLHVLSCFAFFFLFLFLCFLSHCVDLPNSRTADSATVLIVSLPWCTLEVILAANRGFRLVRLVHR